MFFRTLCNEICNANNNNVDWCGVADRHLRRTDCMKLSPAGTKAQTPSPMTYGRTNNALPAPSFCDRLATHSVVHKDFGIHTMSMFCATPFDNNWFVFNVLFADETSRKYVSLSGLISSSNAGSMCCQNMSKVVQQLGLSEPKHLGIEKIEI